MKTTISALVASTALTAALGWSASAAIGSVTNTDALPTRAKAVAEAATPPVILADNDDDDDHRSRSGHDDDDDEEDDDCDDDECAGSAGNPAPAGTVAPPSNGLFENGAAPQVQVN